MIFLVHHSDAVGPGDNPQRPLSDLGLLQAAWLAEHARAAGCAPAAIWHSGKLRARQTAEAFLRTCNPMAEFRMVRGLGPEDPPEWMRDELDAESREVLLVGHMPHLPALARSLSPEAGEFPLHGAVAFSQSGARTWVEAWRLVAPSE